MTGEYVKIEGNLTLNATGLGNVPVKFFLNGTEFATATTFSDGTLSINATIPFVYVPTVAIWAVASPDSSRGFVGAVSNTLYFTLLFNDTKIEIG